MRIPLSVLFRYTLFFLWLIAGLSAWAGWEEDFSLKREYREHPFLAACREGNVPAVQYYIGQDNSDFNQLFISGFSQRPVSGFLLAAQNGHVEVVQALIEAGANRNQACGGATPLYTAAEHGRVEVVRVLAGTEVNLNQTCEGATPLFIAAQNGYPEIVEILIKAGADPTIPWTYWYFFTKTPLIIAKDKRDQPGGLDSYKYREYCRIVGCLEKAEMEWNSSKKAAARPERKRVSLFKITGSDGQKTNDHDIEMLVLRSGQGK